MLRQPLSAMRRLFDALDNVVYPTFERDRDPHRGDSSIIIGDFLEIGERLRRRRPSSPTEFGERRRDLSITGDFAAIDRGKRRFDCTQFFLRGDIVACQFRFYLIGDVHEFLLCRLRPGPHPIQ